MKITIVFLKILRILIIWRFKGDFVLAVVRIFDGVKYVDVEVTDEFKLAYDEMNRQEKLSNRRYYSHNVSLETLLDKGYDFELIKEAFETEGQDFIEYAFSILSDFDKKIMVAYFVDDRTERDIALEIGCSRVYINKVITKNLKKIKKFLENGYI